MVVTGSPDPVRRFSPFTVQSGGCGQRGDFVSLPKSFLTRSNQTWATWGDPAKVLVAEWAKLRYGVFDEFGFPGDPVYPAHFTVGGSIVPTGSSDGPVAGSWRSALDSSEGCEPTSTSKNCFFQPSDSASNARLECSLGYLPFLPGVKRFCRGEEARRGSHGAMAPTKHNVLCAGNSVPDVVYR